MIKLPSIVPMNWHRLSPNNISKTSERKWKYLPADDCSDYLIIHAFWNFSQKIQVASDTNSNGLLNEVLSTQEEGVSSVDGEDW